MRLFSMILVFFALQPTGFFQACGQLRSPVIEEQTVGEFRLSVCLPADYDTIKRYKVLYFNDGQTIFGINGLDVDGMMEELVNNKLIEPIIIVGIHSDQNRTSNYVPYYDESAKNDFGNYSPDAAGYSAKIIKKIIPYIEKTYRTKPGRGIAGYSFGGLHATWIALNYPDYFSFSGSLSPSYWVNDFKIFSEGAKARNTQTYYFDVGTGEWNYYVPMLLQSKLPMLQHIFYYEEFGGTHSVNSWRGDRVRNILLLFAGNTDLKKYTWSIKQEVIWSRYTGKFYLRVNPIINYSNGLTCSASYAATFTLLNTDDGVVNKDGSFRFINPKDLHVKIEFAGEERMILINYGETEKIKKDEIH
jgi:predicted alpha/beta superfamily hydrolase